MRKNQNSTYLPLIAFLTFLICLVFASCKSKPPVVEPEMAPTLVFENVEAEDPLHLNLNYNLNMSNPFPQAGRVRLESWRVELNGQKASTGFILEKRDSLNFTIRAAAGEPAFVSIPVRLNMDVAALNAQGNAQGITPSDDYRVNLVLVLEFSPDKENAQSMVLEVPGLAVFPGVRAPVFNITSIAILKAELVNTRFRVGLKIDNPNPYPVELSAFAYELYGNGRLWADGIEKNILKVNAKSSLQGNLFLIMNFINMKRDLLDQIINLEDVNYRFAGDAMVGTGVDYLPEFKTSFNLSGYSQVLDN